MCFIRRYANFGAKPRCSARKRGRVAVRSSLFVATCVLLVTALPAVAHEGTFTPDQSKESAEASPEKPPTKPLLSVPNAMQMLYGNYDARTKSSRTTVQEANSKKLGGAGAQRLSVRPAFHADFDEDGANKFVLVTYAIPQAGGFGCHACAPTIGMAVFSNAGLTPIIEASNKAVTQAGSWGEPPADIQLAQIGTDHHAIQIRDVWGGQGETIKVLTILVPWDGTVNLALQRIISDDDKGACGPGGLACYSNRRTVTFLRHADADYYDLELELTGTDLPPSQTTAVSRARKVSGVEILRLEKGKYMQISRQGDLTTVDQAVKEKEGLK